MGAAAEKRGDMGSAIMYYRQAVQLVPDVEFKACSKEPDKLQNGEPDAVCHWLYVRVCGCRAGGR